MDSIPEEEGTVVMLSENQRRPELPLGMNSQGRGNPVVAQQNHVGGSEPSDAKSCWLSPEAAAQCWNIAHGAESTRKLEVSDRPELRSEKGSGTNSAEHPPGRLAIGS